MSRPGGAGLIKGHSDVTLTTRDSLPDSMLKPPAPVRKQPPLRLPEEALGRGAAASSPSGELRLHAVRAQVPRLVHLHRAHQDPRARQQRETAKPLRGQQARASTSTARCACTAASASESARSGAVHRSIFSTRGPHLGPDPRPVAAQWMGDHCPAGYRVQLGAEESRRYRDE